MRHFLLLLRLFLKAPIFCQPVIDHIDLIGSIIIVGIVKAQEEVLRLYAAVKDPITMHSLNQLDQLDGNEEACFQIELSLAHLK